MTEYTDKVRQVKFKLDAEKWGRELNYYHFNNGVREICYNNGLTKFENISTGLKWTTYPKNYGESIYDKFRRYLVDTRLKITD
jgi:hypothetical protein